MESSLFVKIRHVSKDWSLEAWFWKWKFDFLKSENSMRRAAVQECGTVFLHNVRGVHSQDIFQSHINLDLTNMKCRSQLSIP